MNLFKSIKAKLNRKKIKLLNPGKSELAVKGDTQELITIDKIEQILKNPSVFDAFLSKDKCDMFFSDGIGFNDYVQAIKDYITFFSNNNFIFDKEELQRASIITGEKYKKIKPKKSYTLEEISAQLMHKDNVQNYSKNNKKINSISDFSAYMEDSEAVHSSNILISVCDQNVIYDELLESLLTSVARLGAQSKVLALDDERKMQVDTLRQIAENNLSYSEQKIERFKPKNYNLDPDFEQMVMSKIPNNIENKGLLAYEIYKAVFSSVQYDTGYFIKGSDEFSEDFIQRILNKSIGDINNQNNRITCTTGTELLCYFLNKYGIDCAIVKKSSMAKENRCHCWAEIYLDNDVIVADATNGVIDENRINMTDISRIKLGIKPANYKSQKGISYSKYENDNKETAGYVLQNDVDTIKNLIAEQEGKKDLHSVSIGEKVEILKEQLKKVSNVQLGNFATTQYMRALFVKLFQTNMNDLDIGITSSLYTKEAEDVYSYFTLIYVKSPENGYHYYCYDENEGLKVISKESILEKINNNELFIQKGKENRLPGLYNEEKNENIKDIEL